MAKAEDFLLGLKCENSYFCINYFEKYDKFKSREGKSFRFGGLLFSPHPN